MGRRPSRKTRVEKPREREQVVPVDRGERERNPIWPSALYLAGGDDFAIICKRNANANGLAKVFNVSEEVKTGHGEIAGFRQNGSPVDLKLDHEVGADPRMRSLGGMACRRHRVHAWRAILERGVAKA